jgi:hypothetical protein
MVGRVKDNPDVHHDVDEDAILGHDATSLINLVPVSADLLDTNSVVRGIREGAEKAQFPGAVLPVKPLPS